MANEATKCGDSSPQSGTRCFWDKNHKGSHSGFDGVVQVSWANLSVPETSIDTESRYTEAMRHLVKRLCDECGPEAWESFVNRVSSGERDVPSPWSSKAPASEEEPDDCFTQRWDAAMSFMQDMAEPDAAPASEVPPTIDEMRGLLLEGCSRCAWPDVFGECPDHTAPARLPAGQEEKCGKTMYDQDDGEKYYCQLPTGHTEDCNPWPGEIGVGLVYAAPAPLPAPAGEAKPDQLLDAINWLMGCGDDFYKPAAAPAFWWRSEFAERAGLRYNGSRYEFIKPAESTDKDALIATLRELLKESEAALRNGYHSGDVIQCPECQLVRRIKAALEATHVK